MQIQLKQVEIVAAIKQYITKQGIDLAGKTVKMDFTAGRKEAGLSVEISIEDGDIPGLDDADESPVAKPALSIVTPIVSASPYPSTEAAAPQNEPVPMDEPVPVAAEKAPTSSLFG